MLYLSRNFQNPRWLPIREQMPFTMPNWLICYTQKCLSFAKQTVLNSHVCLYSKLGCRYKNYQGYMASWGHFRNASREKDKNSEWNISIGQSLFVMYSYLPICIYIHILHICAWCCCFLLIFWHRRGKTVRPHTCMRIELCSSILVCSTCTSHDILIYNHFG